MAIIFNEQTKVFTLQTKNTSYQMKVGKYGFLWHLYYGKKINPFDTSYLIKFADRGFSGNPYEAENDRTYSIDTLPLEYPCFGTGDFRTSCLEIENIDGSNAVDLRYVSYEIVDGKYSLEGLPAIYQNDNDIAQTLKIYIQDKFTDVKVILYYGVIENRDIITRACKIQNEGKNTIKIQKALSCCLDFPNINQMELIHFHGRHAMEREFERVPLIHGKMLIDSIRGTSSHQNNPFIILCDKDTTEDYGNCYGMSFVYSGNFKAEVETSQFNTIRAVMGINDNSFSFEVGIGQTFTTPEVVLAYSGNGLSELSKIYHKAYRKNLCRGKYKETIRPVLINNWEATYFKFNAKKLINIADDAAKLGIDLLVMDDGWFGKRDDDFSGLGDWKVNEDKLGCTLNELVKRVNEKGLKFGIWFEPEMVSEDSDLYRTHPDWAIKIPNRLPNRSRNQLVLDFSREDVREFIFKSMCEILDNANIEYIKWDTNRSLTDLYSNVLSSKNQGELCHRYVLGLYDFIEKLINKYPNILFEGCSGGGGRFDAGMLYYMPQIWCSDDTDAIERIKIQYGTSFGYPISTVGSHVSACPNHQTGRTTPLKTRGVVAMSGTFGYELDINKMTNDEKEIVKQQISDFKKYYHLIQDGDYYRLTNPYERNDFAAWQFVSEDKSESLINIVKIHSLANAPFNYIKFKGLDKDKIYDINGKKFNGDVLMYAGYVIPDMLDDFQSLQIYIKEVK